MAQEDDAGFPILRNSRRFHLLVVFGHSDMAAPGESRGIVLYTCSYRPFTCRCLERCLVLFIYGSIGEERRLMESSGRFESRRLLVPYFTIITVVYFARVVLTSLHPKSCIYVMISVGRRG